MEKLSNIDPLKALAGLRQSYKNCFLLESATPGKFRLNRYSFLGFGPEKLIEVKDNIIKVNEKPQQVDNIFNFLKTTLNKYNCTSQFPFAGGLVGYVSYDAIRYIENIPDTTKDDLQLPDMLFGLYTDGIIIDRFANATYYFSLNGSRSKELEKILAQDIEIERGEPIIESIIPNMPKDQFENSVQTVKEKLRSGEAIQTVISQRFDVKSQLKPLGFYEQLRRVNPSNYMYLLDFDAKIIGSSPESLVKNTGKIVETNPIAGTRPRGKTPEQDKVLAEKLLADPKEQAEHIMLVDLGRNDIGKVSKFGTVQIPEYMTVEKYSHVQHIVSRVTGELKPGLDSFDAFKAIFPAGTVSGAPKIRAMEIIDSLEPTKRGPYAGAVGYFSFNGNMDFAIAIRTAILKNSIYSIQAGAGIVLDSIPEKEHFECKYKASALIKSLGGSDENFSN